MRSFSQLKTKELIQITNKLQTVEKICKNCVFLYEFYDNPYFSKKYCGLYEINSQHGSAETTYHQTCEYFQAEHHEDCLKHMDGLECPSCICKEILYEKIGVQKYFLKE